MKVSGWAQVWLVIACVVALATAYVGNMLSEAYSDAMYDSVDASGTAFVWGVIGIVVGAALWLAVMVLKGIVNWAERAARRTRGP